MPINHIVELFALDERSFICEAYRNLLGREPDQQGMAYYLGRLSLGYSKASIIVDLAQSKEVRNINKIIGLKTIIDNEKREKNPLRKIFNMPWNNDRPGKNSRATEFVLSQGVRDITNILNNLNHHIAKISEYQSANGLKNENVLNSMESKNLLKEQEVMDVYLKLLGRRVESYSVLESRMKFSSVDELSNEIKMSPEYAERNRRLMIPSLPVKPLVTIIIVNLNGSIHLSDLFASIKKQSYDNFEVVFVDNGSTDNSIAKAKEVYSNVKVVALERNYGFAEANNIGYEVANGDLILLLNNDMVIADNFLELLVQEFLMDKDNKIGAVSPKILFFTRFITITIDSTKEFSLFREEILQNLNGSYNKIIDRSGIETKKLQHEFLVPCGNGEINFRLDGLTVSSEITNISINDESLFNWTIDLSAESFMLRLELSGYAGHFVINNAGSYVNSNGDAGDIGFMEDDNMQYDSAQNVDAFCGGAVLIRRDALARKQLFCSDFFAYYEDTELSLNLTKAGWIIKYVPDCIVYHKHAATSNDKSLLFKTLTERNRLLFIAIHFPDLIDSSINEKLSEYNHLVFEKDRVPFDDVTKQFISILPQFMEKLPSFVHRGVNGLVFERKYHFRRVAVYNEYWNTRGGGELRAIYFAMALSKFYHVDLISSSQFSLNELSDYFNVDLRGISKRVIPDFESSHTKDYFIFVNSTYASNVISSAKISINLLNFPHKNPVNGFIESYDLNLAVSKYTKEYASRYWGDITPTDVLYPPVFLPAQSLLENAEKNKTIISVGRFFVGCHSKNQHVLINTFKRLSLISEFCNWRLVLVGSVNRNNPTDLHYLDSLFSAAKGLNVEIKPDCTREHLNLLLRDSSIYWHASGLGNNRCEPENFEHFGMSIVEAMGYGCVPIVFNGGGIPEIISAISDGCTYEDSEGLFLHSASIMRIFNKNRKKYREISRLFVNRANEFNISSHDKRLVNIVESLVGDARGQDGYRLDDTHARAFSGSNGWPDLRSP